MIRSARSKLKQKQKQSPVDGQKFRKTAGSIPGSTAIKTAERGYFSLLVGASADQIGVFQPSMSEGFTPFRSPLKLKVTGL